ncbi:hypothetical protein E2C01_066749 [Portunus trituberculatus]|uniref:Uncharacterized protein n=1 Tax=Portunus trituberculatus TaxID=210409 RepID=A0A5B7HQN0_PORTR|nr:hypothetical protein [Portunus trituberculatus]
MTGVARHGTGQGKAGQDMGWGGVGRGCVADVPGLDTHVTSPVTWRPSSSRRSVEDWQPAPRCHFPPITT